MPKRFVAIWFRHLTTDRLIRSRPELHAVPFVIAARERGRIVVKAVSKAAHAKGIHTEMVVADCRAMFPDLQVFDVVPDAAEKLLHALAEWCLRYTPIVAIDSPDGLMLDVSGCTHLWGGERLYLKDLLIRLRNYGYDVSVAMADTIGTAWAISHFGRTSAIIEPGGQADALCSLPPAALRVETDVVQRLEKLGLYRIRSFMTMPRRALSRRFGQALLSRLDQALGQEHETLHPIHTIEPFQERLPCLEPIRTATGIEIALTRLLEMLCERLRKEEKGLRKCVFKGYRVDGNIQQIEIGTNRPSRNTGHIFKLFEIKIPQIMPALGIELFILEAPIVEDISPEQEKLWNIGVGEDNAEVADFLDRVAGKVGMNTIRRYLPAEHYWPERSIKLASSLKEKPQTVWRKDLPRPVHLLPRPEPIEVTVPIPDYPPMLFIYKGQLHNIAKADGPERIEQEWWIEKGQQRDYYCVEDEHGARYWLFRLGLYSAGEPAWFIHGFFA